MSQMYIYRQPIMEAIPSRRMPFIAYRPAAVPHLQHQHNERLLPDGANHAIISNPVTPCAFYGEERLSETARILYPFEVF